MTMYLLLRDNKQSGPYSLDELKTMGLKAYDLVWVDGKSAAWRYPCEVEELSAFAPAVEEQPFDRFYKKSASTAKPASAAATSSPNAFTSEPSTVSGKRIIYVTMPAGKGQGVLTREPVRSTSSIQATVNRSTDTPDIRPVTPVDNNNLSSWQPAPSNSPVMDNNEEKLSQVREDWKKDVEITPLIKKRKASRIYQPLAVAVCVLALLAAGIFIGMSINRRTLGSGKKIAVNGSPATQGNEQSTNRVSQVSQQPLPAAAAPTSQVQTTPADSVHTLSSTSLAVAAPATRVSSGKPPRQPSSRGKSTTGNGRNQPNQSVLPALTKDSSSLGIPVIHREAVHRADIPADRSENVDKEVVKNNIANLVSVGTSGYTVGTFGGISGLQLTVSNRSVYPLDLVVVEVQYIQANKKVFKTENLYFRGIGPGSALMQEAPKSTRGIKVQYKITLVNSKELGLSYSGI
jgi:hypothetical protein